MNDYKPVPDFPGYKINSIGHMINKNGRPVKPRKDKEGYMIYSLKDKGRKKNKRAHRLVALLFVPNPNNLPEVNHTNGNKSDLRAEVLEWVTPKDNIKHAWDTGLANSNHCRHKVVSINILSNEVRQFYSTREAERILKIGNGYVSAVLRGQYQSAKGYKFLKSA